MTPSEIILAARQSTNNEDSDFITDAELITYLNFGLKDACLKSKIYEVIDTSTVSVASQDWYDLPTNIFEPKRIEYDGLKLRPSTLAELDTLVSAIQNNEVEGTPRYYAIFAEQIKLVPTPDTAADVIKIYGHSLHPDLTTSSTSLSIPADFHPYLIDYIVHRIYLKEGDTERSRGHYELWLQHLDAMKKQMLERKKRDRFNVVQNEDRGPSNGLGLV